MTQQPKLLAAISLAFVAMGMALGSFGPALSDLARQTVSNLEDAGFALTTLGLGIVAGQALGTLSLKPFGHRAALLTGMLLFVIGAIGVITGFTLTIFVAAAALAGLGMGFMALAVNVIAAEAFQGAGALNFVNAMFGAGAILSPALVALSISIFQTAIPALWIAPFTMFFAILASVVWVPRQLSPHANDGVGDKPRAYSLIIILALPIVWLIGMFLFTINAIEAGTSGWISSMLTVATGITSASGALAASLYWLMVTLARFLAAWASKFVAPDVILQTCVGSLGIGSVLLVGSAMFVSPALGFAAAAILGLSAGPVLPTTLAIVRQSFPQASGIITGLVIVMGNIGGAASSFLLGFLLFRFGGAAATTVFVALSLAASALFIIMRWQLHSLRPFRNPAF